MHHQNGFRRQLLRFYLNAETALAMCKPTLRLNAQSNSSIRYRSGMSAPSPIECNAGIVEGQLYIAATRPADQLMQSASDRAHSLATPRITCAWTGSSLSRPASLYLACLSMAGRTITAKSTKPSSRHGTPFSTARSVSPGLALIVTHFRNVGRGHRCRTALPVGYGLSLVGFFAFATGGVGDLGWHEIFGFEESLEALLSPSHLFLALSGLLIITGPIRAFWGRETENNWRSLLPVILAFTCITSIFTFFTTFAAVTSELTT